MAIIQDPSTTNVATVDPTFKALRTVLYGQKQSYRTALRSGTIAAATAAGFVYSFRNTGSKIATLLSVRLGMQILSAYTQGNITFTLVRVNGMLLAADTGGTVGAYGNTQKIRYDVQNANDAELRISSTTVLGAGIGTVEDANAFASIQHDLPSAALVAQPMKEFLNYSAYSSMIKIYPGEGFRIKNTAYAATGTSNVVVQVEWAEEDNELKG